MMAYVDQSAKDLRFYLVQGNVDVQSLTILATDTVAWGERSVTMGILGASHFLSIAGCETPILNEVFACADLDTFGPFLKSGPLGQLQATVQITVDALAYTFTPRLVSWDEGEEELRQLIDAVARAKGCANQVGLLFEFPSTGNDSRRPYTIVWGDATDELLVRTVHCYPNEATLVFTETTLRERTTP